MATPREHIEQIRREKFSVGREENPLVEDLHHAVKHLSAELYTKDVHFLMELIQNAEDNDYAVDVDPSTEFVITNIDITGVGAPATLLVFNNEKGFTAKNIDSVCSVGRSTKKGKRQGGDYIGEKGIGFKSVFLVTRHPYIFSNGYQIRFNEVPPPDTKIGYIVPEWVDDKPSLEDILNVYGGRSVEEIPTTVIILPLRHEKVEAVKEQLATVHPEMILFLSKIKRFSVREENQKKVNSISVSKETAFQSIKNEESESFILHLTAQENNESNEECSYYMWRQRFPVKSENRVEGREEVENWVITLAFPRDERVTTTRNKVSTGIYAFLPTEMVTGLPFIIQADFMLVSSRESIRWDNMWNQGILECVPAAFVSAFVFLVKSVESAPPSSRSSCFDKYLPIGSLSYAQLESMRQAIQSLLKEEEIILCEGQNKYCTPSQARRVLPTFRKILQKSDKPRNALWSDEVFLVHPCMDNLKSLVFLGVQYVNFGWYSNYITCDPAWVRRLSEDAYVQLLYFVSQYWMEYAIRVDLHPFPLLKYHSDNCLSGVDWISITQLSSSDQHRIYFCQSARDFDWLIRWNRELGGPRGRYKFFPKATQAIITSQQPSLLQWLYRYAKLTDLSLSSFTQEVIEDICHSRNKEFVVRVAQFVHFSAVNKYMDYTKAQTLCSKLPIVSESGSIVRNMQTKLVPAEIGKWAKLMGQNRWATKEAVILSADYLSPPTCALQLVGASRHDLTLFITDGLNAKDIPHLKPPSGQVPDQFPFVIGQEEAVFLLSWIQHLIQTSSKSLPANFKRSIMEAKWLNTTRGYQSPNMCFLSDSEWSQAGLQSSDLSFIDSSFYVRYLHIYRTALRYIGVVVKFGEGCEVVAKHLEMHTDFEAITRLYKYLSRFNWKPKEEESVRIWIPSQGGHGEWKDPKMCIIYDDWGISNHKLHVLENIYEASLLPFFSDILGVVVRPRVEEYCNVWLDWSSANSHVAETDCCSIWKGILKYWSHSPSKVEYIMGGKFLKFPTLKTNFGDSLKLGAATDVFVPDDLKLTALFRRKSTRSIFAWHPNPSDSEIPLPLLFKLYNSLGVKNISEVVMRNEVSIPVDASLGKLQRGKGFLRRGLYQIILAYLAYPSFGFSVDKRHEIVKSLLESPVYQIAEPMAISYTLTIRGEHGGTENIVATAPSFVRWEKHNNRILIQLSDLHNPKVQYSLATEFAEVVSKGLLSVEYPDLEAGLCEMLKEGCILHFHDEVVDEILQKKNMQLFVEDLEFLILQEEFKTCYIQ